MSADQLATLQLATRKIREEWQPVRGGGWSVVQAYHVALADWLDTAGADLWAHGPLCSCDGGCDNCDDVFWMPHVRAALAVAHAYLGTEATA